MEGIRPHSHTDRARVLRELVPAFRREHGDNLLAVAVQASYARGDDAAYSDLEIAVFLRTATPEHPLGWTSTIRDGLLIEIWYTTREDYLAKIKNVTDEWYIAGSDVIEPLLNAPFLEELRSTEIPDLREKCRQRAARLWPGFQEDVTKTLNAIDAANRQGLPMVLFYLLKDTLALAAFLNARPYTTLGKYIEQARALPVRPDGLDMFLDIMVAGEYRDLAGLRAVVVAMFEGFERCFAEEGIRLYPYGRLPGEG